MVIGVDVGGMSAKAAVLCDDGTIKGKCRVETSAERTPEETARSIAALCEEAAREAGVDFGTIRAIGVGAPGVIDSANGEIVSWTNFGWKNVPLARMIWERTRKRTFVTNDANAAALGEAKYGAGSRYQDSILITLGTGVGSGIVIGGKLFEGYRSAGGELGHTVIRKNGELCSCGRRGCFERYASASALLRMTRHAMHAHPESAMFRFAATPEEADGKTVFLALREGDETAKKVVDEYLELLGEGIVNAVNLLRPQAVILGGGISAEGETILGPLRAFVEKNIYVSERYAPLEIVCAQLGNDAGLYGAAQYALQHIL